ncbi:MAG TPA: hypothetical protein VKT78_15035 [Fimbriimonadaceae bacterium]|nr:hypothetical protein [Fimbriimonadaceae bacterium]
MRLGRTACLAAIGLLLAGAYGQTYGGLHQDGEPLVKDSDQATFFAWFDTLGYAPIVSGRFVQIETWDPVHPEWRHDFSFGFQGRSDRGTLEVVTTELDSPGSQWRTEREIPATKRYTVVDFAHWAHDTFEKHKGQRELDSERFEMDPGAVLELVVTARACAARGLDDLAAKCFHEATLAQLGYGNACSLREDIANVAYESCVLTLDDASQPRGRALGLFRAFVKRYGFSSWIPESTEAIKTLERMDAADRARTSHPAGDLSTLNLHDRIAELIYRLQDQVGYQTSVPGGPDVFGDAWNSPFGITRAGAEREPATMLSRLGYAAVPQLIQALSDNRFTRTSGIARFEGGREYNCPVWRVAEIILRRITSNGFEIKTPDESKPYQVQLKAAVEAWWQEAKPLGEREVLIRGIRSQAKEAYWYAPRLVEGYPKEALGVIASALPKADAYMQERLISSLQNLHDPNVAAVARTYLVHGKALEVKLAAAHVLAPTHPSLAVDAMRTEWERARKSRNPGVLGERDLAAFLLSSGRADAVRTIADGFRALPGGLRFEVLQSMEFQPLPPETPSQQWGPTPKPPSSPQARIAFEHAIEDLLASELSDTDVQKGLQVFDPDDSYADPRVCDEAGIALARRWPQKYRFHIAGPMSTRDQSRLECLNTWRISRGLSPVSTP